MISFITKIATARGDCQQFDTTGKPIPSVMRSGTFARHQAPVIPLCVGHTDWQIGRVEFLGRNRYCLACVGRIPDAPSVITRGDPHQKIPNRDLAELLEDGEWFLSPGVFGVRLDQFEIGHTMLRHVALERETGVIGTQPVYWCPGDIASGWRPRDLPLLMGDVWDRAAEVLSDPRRRYRKPPESLDIVDLDQLSIADEVITDPKAARERVQRAEAAKARAASDREPDRVYRHHVGGSVTSFSYDPD